MTARLLLLCVTLAGCDKGPSTSEANAAPAPTAPEASTGSTADPAAAGSEQTFGAGVSLAETTSVDALLANPTAFHGKTVRVEGMVTDVCPKRGCWFDVAGSKPGQKVKFKVTDGEMVFPPESKGMRAVAQGQVVVRQLSLEETRQYAAYQASEYGQPFDPASITEPMQVVRIDGTGAVIRGAK